MTKLSIIIPCHNCEDTLIEAVDSIYRQDAPIPFDVTMVDDGSTDGTYTVMQSAAAAHPEVKLLRHDVNRGGGAARNTAAANSDGDLLFCLDSDDMLGPDCLKNMIGFWLKKRCDGLGISTSIKFRKRNLNDVAYVTRFEGPGEEVRFDSLLDSSRCSLYSTFLITRNAFQQIGGYPTAHGWDTQGMAFRFLCNGKQAYTCPETVYYHRVEFHPSYYQREDRAGRAHWNAFQIVNEFLYLFKEDTQERILKYEVFPEHPQALLIDQLREMGAGTALFRDGYAALVKLGRDGAAARLQESPDKYDQYWVGSYLLSKGRYSEALDAFARALKSGFDHQIIYTELLEAALRLSGGARAAAITIGNTKYYANDAARSVQSALPPLSRYQSFENELLQRKGWRPLGKVLRSARLGIRRMRRRGA